MGARRESKAIERSIRPGNVEIAAILFKGTLGETRRDSLGSRDVRRRN
ncbi:MAG: hypothetical protein ACI91F_002558 [Candidatus Binatia bacterium]|jgi:hypothetical protein